MKIFLDTAEADKIRRFAEMGMVDGVTTNPTLILKSGRKQKDAILEICKLVPGPVSVEGVSEKAKDMAADGEEFASWAANVVVKVPMTEEGLRAVRMLSKKGIKTNVTLVFSAAQALLAAKAGATFVSPFLGRLDDVGEEGMELVRQIVAIYRNYGFKTSVLAASIRSPLHVVQAALAGADISTVPPDVLEKMFRHGFTDAGIKKFLEDYNSAKKKTG
ncbi:TPA: fructose-6-phosphate aldolase [Candidatus Micrarchaeota archaeon]|nr:fructose-6-phosphate aldolase [Candidatus Micrarchaeota archaeon]